LNLDGLSSITSFDRLVIEDNYLLANLNGLSNFTSIDELTIADNDKLINLDAFSNLNTINSLQISKNQSLKNINGLFNVNSKLNNLTIYSNKSLDNLDGLANMSLNNNADLTITDSDLITDIVLKKDDVIGLFSISIKGMIKLKSLDFLSNINSVEQEFNILGNHSLVDLNGLSELKIIKGENEYSEYCFPFSIEYNKQLKDFCGLKNTEFKCSGPIGGNGYNPTITQITTDECSR
tara:strand:+ start:385 stop:1092 length:708 start_codon:yes stop_codon:yes gene_type:complete